MWKDDDLRQQDEALIRTQWSKHVGLVNDLATLIRIIFPSLSDAFLILGVSGLPQVVYVYILTFSFFVRASLVLTI